MATHLWMCLIWLWSGHVWLLQYWGERSARGLNISSPSSKCSTENPAILEIIHHITVGGAAKQGYIWGREGHRYYGGHVQLGFITSVRICTDCAWEYKSRHTHICTLTLGEPGFFKDFYKADFSPDHRDIHIIAYLTVVYLQKSHRLLPPSALEYLHMQRRWITRFLSHVNFSGSHVDWINSFRHALLKRTNCSFFNMS